ncbi:hypothetical protein [Dietzia sp.]|uniref:hypothetical protein n=1 Tax=Dietzia sp. TaxID=1871616 RepID=UPI002FD92DFE
MPITEELSAETAGVVAVVDAGEEKEPGGGERLAVWHVAVTPEDPGPRLRGAWVIDQTADADGFARLVRNRPVWPLSARAAEAAGEFASFLVDAEATDAAVVDAVAALDSAFASGKEAAGPSAKWVRPDWAVSARLVEGAGAAEVAGDSADSEGREEAEGGAGETATRGGPMDGDPLAARALTGAKALEELAIQWASTQALRTAKQGKAGSRAFLLAAELGGPEPAALPLAGR